MNYVDFHTHSVYSDGTKTISELVEEAKEKGIKYFSITDHDCINGLAEANELCKINDINFVNGIELSADFKGEEIHVLAYNFDLDNPYLKEFLNKTLIARTKRNESILQKISDAGININKDNLLTKEDGVITRADIAQELVNVGVAKDNTEAFDKYLKSGRLFYAKRDSFSYKEIFHLIRNMNAISSLAHPSNYDFFKTSLKSSIQEMRRNGLDAIECYHSSYSLNTTNTLLGYCNRFDLLQTGGSDYHGDKKPNVQLGNSTNSMLLEKDLLDDFISKIF